MKPSEIVKAAAATIRERGWCQGTYFSGDRCCIYGALGVVTRSPLVESECAREIVQDLGTGLVKFNDAPGRTQAEVLAALEATAARLEGEGR
jgi:hypothetical protein